MTSNGFDDRFGYLDLKRRVGFEYGPHTLLIQMFNGFVDALFKCRIKTLLQKRILFFCGFWGKGERHKLLCIDHYSTLGAIARSGDYAASCVGIT
jgi:hypothetical protein